MAKQPTQQRDYSNAEPLLQIQNLDVGFQSERGMIPAVRGANLTVYPGQTVAIVGESGSGKSTTAHAIIDLLPGSGQVTGGKILFEGKEITGISRKAIVALRGSSIGLVPQDPMSNLNPVWRIGFQVKEALKANGLGKGKGADARVVELLGEAGLPDAARRAKQYPHEFSGGMRQRALIAIGLAARPKLLIADEPTSALDVTVQQQILTHLDKLTSELGVAVLLITHDLGLAAERAEQLVVMYKGQVVESGPALELLRNPQHPYTQRLVASAPSLTSRRLQSTVARVEGGARTSTHGSSGDGSVSDAAKAARGDNVIEVENLTKVFKIRGGAPGSSNSFTAVDDVSFVVPRGTTTAIVGESGSGKSTVALMVLRLLDPTSGKVSIDGHDIAAFKGKELLAMRRKMQPIFQNPYGSLDPMYSIYRTIEEPLRTHGIGDNKSREKKVRELLDKVSLPSTAMRRFPNELSGGQRQRVAVARALALDPEVVICDEAVSALDVLVQAQVLNLLNDLQAELGLSYLFITHDLAVVRQIADDVLVMKDGAIVEKSSTDEVFAHPKQEYTKALLAAIPGSGLDFSGNS
ncbi:ABC transporter ATP-binding protein [Nakamurella antarctica]|uniref:ABC transporter ATP-binding protein n=1 Tax=Nakamurella antarctica TaxID=1902245 RepID=A0A3G8ZQF0_9ACTN|nr:ABC transporter ATP-binding protein [Nakamurella antarctica]